MATLRRLIGRLQGTLIGRFLARFQASRPEYLASALAFQIALSLFPLAILALMLVDAGGHWVMGERALDNALGEILPSYSRHTIVDILTSVRLHRGLIGVLAGVGLIWAGSLLFGTMENAFNRIYRAPPRSFLRQKLMSLVMVVVFFVLLLVGAASTALTVSFSTTVNHLFSFMPTATLRQLLVTMLGIGSSLVLFGLIYTVVPNLRLGPRRTWLGTVVATVAFQGVAAGFGLYAHLSHFDRYGVYGVVVVGLLWFYYLAQILLIGAALNQFFLGQDAPQGIL